MDIPKPETSSQDSSAGEDMGDSSVINIFYAHKCNRLLKKVIPDNVHLSSLLEIREMEVGYCTELLVLFSLDVLSSSEKPLDPNVFGSTPDSCCNVLQ